MISIVTLRDFLELPPERDSELRLAINAVVRDFERRTKIQWRESTGEIKTFSLETTLQRESALRIYAASVSIVNVTEKNIGEDTAETITHFRGHQSVRDAIFRLDLEPGYLWDEVVTVTYDCGYTSFHTAEHADIIEAMLYQIKFLRAKNEGDKLVTESLGFEGGSTRFKKGSMHELYKDVVNRCKAKM